jgi:hypothetical protein
VLTDEEISGFVSDGYVAVRGAVPAEVTRACQDVIWSELASSGVRRDDRSTWTAPVVRIPCPEGGPFVEAGMSVRLQEACDQLLGPDRWWRRPGVGGSIPVRFPSEEDPGDAGWHLDGGFEADGGRRVNIRSRGAALLALFLFSDVDERSAPTRLRPGSHTDTARVLAPAGEAGLEWADAARQAAEASARRPVVLATGQAGDVFLGHEFLVHAASWPHRGDQPRMMAQPSIVLLSEYPLPALPAPSATLAEQAILRSIS